MITYVDPFGLDKKQYRSMKCVKGTGLLYYYDFNLNLNEINSELNGLVTI